MENIRNFCILAHIDHGKSTLADRLLQLTKSVSERDYQDQLLDDMDLERERGITIKSHAILMDYYLDNQKYYLNLIDTPGHVDFSYEVSRSIAACEGALLVVDAVQGIQAQTISNVYLAIDHDLEIIPVLNKIDLEAAKPEEVKDQVVELLGCDRNEIIEASGKTGEGVDVILERIIEKIPPPVGDTNAPLQAMIFDSVFNSYRGIIAYFRIFNGKLDKGDHVKFVNTGKDYYADEIGVLRLEKEPRNSLSAGDVGYIISGIKASREVKVGDTVTQYDNPCDKAVSGFEDVKPMVFAGIYPVDADDYEELRNSLEKLQLNDASLTFEPESSAALGFGFRCGFLGLLHMEIVQEKNIDHIEEPFIHAQIISKADFIGSIMTLCLDKRGTLKNQVFQPNNRVEVTFEMPLAEIVFDFYDKLKSISKGYASFDYYQTGYKEAKLVRLDILINGNMVDALSTLIHREHAYSFGRRICDKLRELIPRQQFDIAIQAAIGSKIIARETVKALRKDVTAKCYGGDITRKRKLLEKQKKGKKRMRQVGNVEVPQSAFLAVLKLD
jgi:GTP-binding protein LepA